MNKHTIQLCKLINTYDIFNNLDFPFYCDDREIKEHFKNKFIQYYYYDEIGFETPRMFIQRLHALLLVNQDKYKQLYETQLAMNKSNMMLSKNLKETFLRELDNQNKIESNNISKMTNEANNENVNKFLDTPTSLVDIENNYLTNMSTNSDKGTNKSESESNNSSESSGKILEKTEFSSEGDIGVQTPAYAIREWRSVILNLDLVIIKDLEKLFFGILN